jgi:hypothetical protein
MVSGAGATRRRKLMSRLFFFVLVLCLAAFLAVICSLDAQAGGWPWGSNDCHGNSCNTTYDDHSITAEGGDGGSAYAEGGDASSRSGAAAGAAVLGSGNADVDVYNLPTYRVRNDPRFRQNTDVDTSVGVGVDSTNVGIQGQKLTDIDIVNVEAPDVKGAAEEFGKSLERTAQHAPDVRGASAAVANPCGDVQGASAGTGPVILGLQTVSIECKAYRLQQLEDSASGIKVTLSKISFYAAWPVATLIKVATGGILN